jgi:uncharacterized OB-fold protein
MSDGPVPGPDEGYDQWADALAEDGYYLQCPNGHGSLPPRRVCPECGSDDLAEESLPLVGEVATFTEVHVAPPDFVDNTPYVTAVADFGPVRITGIVRGAESSEIEIGTEVEADVRENRTTGKRLIVLRPR